jgi:peptidoglycan/LPS O-acetylase OafA/YrhL
METGGRTKGARVRAFDGLRGLAVAAVLLFHSQLSGARGGFLGVSAFFTLSGYLITSLLLDEHARHGRISLRGFWNRRARRLLPAAYVALAGVLVFGATVATVSQARALRGDVLSALAYIANWHFYFSGQSYAHLFSAPSPVLHFWSLAIEEQFYLLFPLLLIVALRLTKANRVALAAVMAAGIGASVLAGNLLLASSGESRVYYGTDTRAAELLVGALLAVVLARRAPMPTVRRGTRVAATVGGTLALATMVWWWSTVNQSDRWLYRGGFALHACLTAIVIACAFIDGPLARALSWRPLVALGVISYGVYLFHWPIFQWLTPERTGLSTLPLLVLRLAITLPLAIASYWLLEQPVRRRVNWSSVWPKVVAPATVVALVGALFAVTWSPPPPEIVLAALGNAKSAVQLRPLPPPLPTTVAPARSRPRLLKSSTPPAPHPLYRPLRTARPLRIMIVGDSVGLTLGRGFELWAREHGTAEVDNVARMYCPLGRHLPIQEGLGVEHDDLSVCDWTNWWPGNVASFDPDVVIVLFTIWEEVPRRLDGKWRTPGDPDLDRWQLGEYQAATDTLAARGAKLVWLEAPCEPNFRLAPGSPLSMLDRRLLPKLASTRHDVQLLDLNSQICPGGNPLIDYAGVHNARPDGAHYSDAGALAVANWAMPIVLGQAPLPRAS